MLNAGTIKILEQYWNPVHIMLVYNLFFFLFPKLFQLSLPTSGKLLQSIEKNDSID